MRAKSQKPEWLKVRLDTGREFRRIRETLNSLDVGTVCTGARCPNRPECWGGGTATFQVFGETCTRNCGFCAVETGRGAGPDPSEPRRIAEAAYEMGLEHAVLTCVTRDDLDDSGAAHLARCVTALRREVKDVEVLVPDLGKDELETVLAAGPTVLGHNVETVERLQHRVRGGGASLEKSLRTLGLAKDIEPGVVTKSSLMLGLGEAREEVLDAMRRLHAADVEVLTLGQYLRPSPNHLPVERYVPPAEFHELKDEGEEMGFGVVVAGPFVRSSYKAGSAITELRGDFS